MLFNSIFYIMIFDIITAYENEYLTHYLDRNLILPATWVIY